MKTHGLGDVSVEKMADVLSGKDRAGWSNQDIRRTVTVLQEAGLASRARSAGQMVLTAAKQAAENRDARLALPSPLDGALSDQSQGEGGPLGIKDRMRSANAQVNRADGGLPTVDISAVPGSTVRGLRAFLRQKLGISSSIARSVNGVKPPDGPAQRPSS